MIDVAFIDDTSKVSQSEKDEILRLLEHAVSHLSLEEELEMSVTFTDNASIQEINKTYRDKDMPTDVISFAIEDEGDEAFDISSFIDEVMPRDIGDIIISIERAEEQAEEYGHSYQRELGFLAVHGFLHLLGYDHMTPEDEKEMFGIQEKILQSYGLKR